MFKIVQFMMKLLKIKKFSTLIIIVTSTMALTIGAVTIYSSQVGNFIVSIEPTPNLKLLISETDDFSKQETRLTAKGISNMTNITLTDIDVDTIITQDGSVNGERRYIAYNFYLKNTTGMVVNYQMDLQIDKVYKRVDSAIRVMIITNQKDTNIYAKPQEVGNMIGQPESHPYLTTAFIAPTKVLNTTRIDFRDQEVVKYTVIMWLEGEDLQCTDEILGGSIRMSMKFMAKQ